ncbi:alpha/beta hydrolase [Nannocystis sp. ILAH1]|uniref:alpha/beta hydrolase n=1 Tax=Nannocystis sp. ILAH1 TaxID=2996789 RepID=UPI00226DAF6F|nr:alpha/beta fold hydrolase [Nannocystis sp. ILAH1]MCY0989090.1 alpha/beta hydrolase [Nannocystis sp. ILAH1]
MVDPHRITFESHGAPIVGHLFVPAREGRLPAVVVDGPLTSVKEQAQGNHARALAERGFIALAFDHRFFGESGGQPRQYESPPQKIEDLRAAVDFLAAHERVDDRRIGAVGVCAGAGYVAGAVAEDPRIRAFAAVAGFFHDVAMQLKWMGPAGFEATIASGRAARERWEATGQVDTIPAVGEGEVAMPLAEAFNYYGTPRGAVANYVNAFAVMSREHTIPYDAQAAAPRIRVPTAIVHSEKALAPALARSFHAALGGPKAIHWLTSQGQVDFYDDPQLIAAAADIVAVHLRAALG